MYLNGTAEGAIYLVDTLADDIQQLANYEIRENIVIVWTNLYQKVHTKKGSYIRNAVMRVTIDTLNKQYQIKSTIEYKNDKIVNSRSNDFSEWLDVVPGSLAENLIKFAKSLNNRDLKYDLLLTANGKYNPYASPVKRKQ